MLKLLDRALLNLSACEIAELLDVAIPPVKNHGDFFNRIVLCFWVHEIRENKVEQQDGDIYSITASVVSYSVFRPLLGSTHYFQVIACKAIGFTNWLKAFAIVPTDVKTARPLVRSLKGRISAVYGTGSGVQAIS